MVKVFKIVALTIITIAVVLIAVLSITSYVGQIRHEIKARDHALQACAADTVSAASLRHAALAASMVDEYDLLNEYAIISERFESVDALAGTITELRGYDKYVDLAYGYVVERDSLGYAVAGLCREWEATPVSWWPWE